MLRCPLTVINLDRKDLEWHCKRSVQRIQVHSYIERQRFADSECQRRDLIQDDMFDQFSSAASREPNNSRQDSIPESNRPPWEEVLIKHCHHPLTIAASPDLPPLRIRNHQLSDTDSVSSSLVNTVREKTSEEDTASIRDHHVQPHKNASSTYSFDATSLRFSGTYDEQDEHEDETFKEGTTASSVPHLPPDQHPNAILIPQEAPITLPVRLRATSGTLPHFGSPLRIAEAARASSSPTRTDAPAATWPQPYANQAQHEQHMIAYHQRRDTRSSSINHSPGSVTTEQQLEHLSPASNTGLQMFRNEVFEESPASRHQDQSPLQLESTEATDRREHIPMSRPHPDLTSIRRVNNDTSRESSEESSDFEDVIGGLHDGSTPYIPRPSLRVYDDERPSSLQPRTPVGLRRHGMGTTSQGGSPTAPARRSPQLPAAQFRQLIGVMGDRLVYVRLLEGYWQQENQSFTGRARHEEETRHQ